MGKEAIPQSPKVINPFDEAQARFRSPQDGIGCHDCIDFSAGSLPSLDSPQYVPGEANNTEALDKVIQKIRAEISQPES